MDGGVTNKKDVKNEGRTDYVYENKWQYDNLSGTKDFISTQSYVILHRKTRALCNRRHFYHHLSAGERTARFKMGELDTSSEPRRGRHRAPIARS